MGRKIISAVIFIIFAATSSLAVMPLAADICFNRGMRFERRYRWNDADAMFDLALRLDPANAEFYGGQARVYVERSRILKNSAPALASAAAMYSAASLLNPYDLRWELELGTLEAEVFLKEGPSRTDILDRAVGRFRKILEMDPHGQILNYRIGLSLMGLWKYLSRGDREFALKSLRHYHDIIPWTGLSLYGAIWDATRDFEAMMAVTPPKVRYAQKLMNFIREREMWRYRKEAASLLERCREAEEPEAVYEERTAKYRRLLDVKNSIPVSGTDSGIGEGPVALTDWYGGSKFVSNVYDGGNMYWEGTVDRLIRLPAGHESISIDAKGSPAHGVWPYMVVEIDGEVIGERFVQDREWKGYAFSVKPGGGLKVLSVTFVNDASDHASGADRNLYVDNAVAVLKGGA